MNFFLQIVCKNIMQKLFLKFSNHIFPSLLLISSWTQKSMKKLYKVYLIDIPKTYHERLALCLSWDVESKFGTPTST